MFYKKCKLVKEEVNSMEGDYNACDIKSKGLK